MQDKLLVWKMSLFQLVCMRLVMGGLTYTLSKLHVYTSLVAQVGTCRVTEVVSQY